MNGKKLTKYKRNQTNLVIVTKVRKVNKFGNFS